MNDMQKTFGQTTPRASANAGSIQLDEAKARSEAAKACGHEKDHPAAEAWPSTAGGKYSGIN